MAQGEHSTVQRRKVQVQFLAVTLGFEQRRTPLTSLMIAASAGRAKMVLQAIMSTWKGRHR